MKNLQSNQHSNGIKQNPPPLVNEDLCRKKDFQPPFAEPTYKKTSQ